MYTDIYYIFILYYSKVMQHSKYVVSTQSSLYLQLVLLFYGGMFSYIPCLHSLMKDLWNEIDSVLLISVIEKRF
jgi:hypothetical protein